MTEFPGDATQEDIEKKLMRELKAQLVGTGDRQVTISAPLAAKLAELLPSDEELEETDEEKERFAKMNAPAPAATLAATPAAATQATRTAGAKRSRAELEAMTKDELIAEADDHDIEVSTSWLKEDIIKALLRAK